MKNILFMIFILNIYSYSGNIVLSKGTYPACISKDLYSEFVTAIVNSGNFDSLRYYAQKGCTVIIKGTKLNILERNWTTAKVMFTDELTKTTVVMYTSIEAVQ